MISFHFLSLTWSTIALLSSGESLLSFVCVALVVASLQHRSHRPSSSLLVVILILVHYYLLCVLRASPTQQTSLAKQNMKSLTRDLHLLIHEPMPSIRARNQSLLFVLAFSADSVRVDDISQITAMAHYPIANDSYYSTRRMLTVEPNREWMNLNLSQNKSPQSRRVNPNLFHLHPTTGTVATSFWRRSSDTAGNIQILIHCIVETIKFWKARSYRQERMHQVAASESLAPLTGHIQFGQTRWNDT